MNRYLILLILLGICWGVRVSSPIVGESKMPPSGTNDNIVFADSCSLEAVICPEENKNNYETEKIIKVIAILETNYGKTGVGRSRNNLTGLQGSNGYLYFTSPEESIAYSEKLWSSKYEPIGVIDSQLAKWKTGNKNDRSEATLRYISNFHAIYDKI